MTAINPHIRNSGQGKAHQTSHQYCILKTVARVVGFIIGTFVAMVVARDGAVDDSVVTEYHCGAGGGDYCHGHGEGHGESRQDDVCRSAGEYVARKAEYGCCGQAYGHAGDDAAPTYASGDARHHGGGEFRDRPELMAGAQVVDGVLEISFHE